ncbi:MAG TPA: hypothetical protein VFB12_15265 [Ktedonobacteraceae bacterium]|nr:hypothetical protein [Ktedonobacteraceae bacterium]
MTTASRHGLFKQQGLTQDELVDIERLATICNTYDGLDLKLNWNILRSRPLDETNDFLYYEHGMLVGFLPLFSFSLREAEISGMVHSGGKIKIHDVSSADL